MKTKFPKYAVGSQWPEDEQVWVARLRNPFLLAKVELQGLFSLRLHLWPNGVLEKIPIKKQQQVLQGMAGFYFEEVEEYPDDSGDNISVISHPGIKPPLNLVIDNQKSNWTGILRTRDPICLFTVSDELGYDSLTWIPAFQAGDKITPDIPRLATAYWCDFCEREDELEDDG